MSTSEPQASNTSVMDLVYLGFNSQVIALIRQSGEVDWVWKSPKGKSSHVAVLLDGELVIVSVQGYTYALNAETGEQLWYNELKGFGTGIPSLASIRSNSGSAGAAAIMAQQQVAASAAASGS